MPGVALTWRASSRATASTTSFSRLPVGPCAPGSWPPWPASMAMTSGRMPLRIGSCGADLEGTGASSTATSSGAETAGVVGVGTPVAMVYLTGAGWVVPAIDVLALAAGTAGVPVACPLRMACGESCWEVVAGGFAAACWATADVKAAVACAADWVAGGGGTCDVEAGDVEAGDAATTGDCAIGAGPSPGHSRTSREPVAEGSMRGFSTTTGEARSNTMRNVSGVGWPVRTDLTMPTPAGSFSPRMALEAGRSTTRRSGPAREMVLYSPLPSSWISARVPVAPRSTLTLRTSPAETGNARPTASARPTVAFPKRAIPICMGRIQAPSTGKCNHISLNNP